MIEPKKRPRWRRRAFVGVVGGLLGGVAAGIWLHDFDDPVIGQVMSLAAHAPSLLGGYSSTPASAPVQAQAPTVEAPRVQLPPPLPPPLHAKEDDYKRLTSSDATNAMLAQAYELVQECQRNANLLSTGRQPLFDGDKCKLAPGEPDMPTLRRMLEARVERVDFGAELDVFSARSTAFADDRAAWNALLKQAHQSALANGEPSASGAEAPSLIREGDELLADGQAAEAQAAYQQAAVYAVAKAIGMARLTDAIRIQYGKQPLGTVDIGADEGVRAAFAKLASEGERKQAVEAGEALARKWKPAAARQGT